MWTSDSKAIVLRTRKGPVSQSITLIDVETGEVRVIAEKAFHPKQPERNTRGDVVIEIDGERKVLDLRTGKLKTMEEYYAEEEPLDDVRIETVYCNDTMWIVEGGKKREFAHPVAGAELSPTKDRVVFYPVSGGTAVSLLDGFLFVHLGMGPLWDWSPDGSRLVCMGAVEEDGHNLRGAELFICNADGGGMTQLTFTPDMVEDYPGWSPDGMKIAYSGWNTGKIYVAVLEEVK